MLSASGEEADVLEAVKAGASGYLLKSTPAAEVSDAVRRVRDGEPVFTPSLAGLVLSEFRRVATKDPEEPQLTPRENEVLKLVAKGYTYREIARSWFISVKTVQNHVQNILTKLQMRKRYELMRYAIQRASTELRSERAEPLDSARDPYKTGTNSSRGTYAGHPERSCW